MKRFFVCIIVLLCLPLFACTGISNTLGTLSPVADVFHTPAPSPTPEPPQVIAVFGAEENPDFLSGIQESASAASPQIEVLAVPGGVDALSTYKPKGNDVAIVYLEGDTHTLPASDIPVYAFAANGQSVSGGVPYLGYDGNNTAQIALDAAISYPPHLTPVRMIGLFTSEASAAYALWAVEKSDGNVFAKKELFEDALKDTVAQEAQEAAEKAAKKNATEDSAETAPIDLEEPYQLALTAWLTDAFAAYYPGMLDAVFAETGALAVAAADVLAGLGRDDIEVFCAGSDAQAADKRSAILVCVVGVNQYDAGARCLSEAVKLLSAQTAQSAILLPEPIWFADAKQ